MPPVLRYAILHHDGVPDPHFDLMFEVAPESALRAWRAPRWPPRSGDRLTRLPDHRRIYLDYEGPISRDRGSVRRVARGVWSGRLALAACNLRLDGHVALALRQIDADGWECVSVINSAAQ